MNTYIYSTSSLALAKMVQSATAFADLKITISSRPDNWRDEWYVLETVCPDDGLAMRARAYAQGLFDGQFVDLGFKVIKVA